MTYKAPFQFLQINAADLALDWSGESDSIGIVAIGGAEFKVHLPK